MQMYYVCVWERERDIFMIIILFLIPASISSILSEGNLWAYSSRRSPLVTTFHIFPWRNLRSPISNLRWPDSISDCPSSSWSTNAEVPSSISLSFFPTVIECYKRFQSIFEPKMWVAQRIEGLTHLIVTVLSTPESLAALTVPDAPPEGFPPNLGVSSSSFSWNLGRSLKKTVRRISIKWELAYE